jgi:hypothetical protein
LPALPSLKGLNARHEVEDALHPGMAFGRNPHVAKAQAAEQKAEDAPDEAARVRALREAAHLWDRAAEREPPGKRRLEYEARAARNREIAEGAAPEEAEGDGGGQRDPKLLN